MEEAIAVVANTDRQWFDHFRPDNGPHTIDEVNFWRPSAQGAFRAVPRGGPFFLRLKHPVNAIAGFGFFAIDARMSPEMAWEVFGEKNGDPSRDRFVERIRHFRWYLQPTEQHQVRADEQLSCLVLRDVRFLPDSEWIPWERAEEWSPRILGYKRYNLNVGSGRKLAELLHSSLVTPPPDLVSTFAPLSVRERPAVYQSVSQRVGQGTFRTRLMMAYGGRCAVTGEHALPVLEAAHIQEYMSPASNHLQNGLLLRADLHRLFDGGYITITPDLQLKVSSRLDDEFHNGKIYYAMADSRIEVPRDPNARPSPSALRWHAEHVFK